MSLQKRPPEKDEIKNLVFGLFFERNESGELEFNALSVFLLILFFISFVLPLFG